MKKLLLLLLCTMFLASCSKIQPLVQRVSDKISNISLKKNKEEKEIHIPKENEPLADTEHTKEKEEVVATETKELSKTEHTQNSLVKTARNYLGTPHRMGGMDKRGIDCSGLMCVTFQKATVSLPRTSSGQSAVGTTVKKSALKVGDLLFFGAYKGSKKVTHVGMVSAIKSSNEVIFIHTSTRRGVVEDNFYFPHWQDTFIRAKRVL